MGKRCFGDNEGLGPWDLRKAAFCLHQVEGEDTTRLTHTCTLANSNLALWYLLFRVLNYTSSWNTWNNWFFCLFVGVKVSFRFKFGKFRFYPLFLDILFKYLNLVKILFQPYTFLFFFQSQFCTSLRRKQSSFCTPFENCDNTNWALVLTWALSNYYGPYLINKSHKLNNKIIQDNLKIFKKICRNFMKITK